MCTLSSHPDRQSRAPQTTAEKQLEPPVYRHFRPDDPGVPEARQLTSQEPHTQDNDRYKAASYLKGVMNNIRPPMYPFRDHEQRVFSRDASKDRAKHTGSM